MWTIFEVFIEFVTTLLLLFYALFFGHEACGTRVLLAQGSNQHPLHWKHVALTTGPPGKSQ